ncbi:MAG: methyltransferase domain-containing protein [Acidobacteriota bacterium]|nr:methyltransferase domain-containing protein [Acidobacteriota bacterium]
MALDYSDYPSGGFDVTADVEARSFWCRTRNRVLTQLFRRFTDSSRPLDVLEIGCGIGGVIGALRQLPHLRLTGSEIYIQGLKYARSKMPDVDFIQLDATSIPFHAGFDVVGAFDVLEHIEQDELVMRQVHAALRPDGLFVVTVPQYQWMWSTLDEIVNHKRRYARRQLTERLHRAGFEVIYATSFVTTLFPFMVMSRLLDRGEARAADTTTEFAERVTLPRPLNILFDWIMRIDEWVLRAGPTLPFGGSLLVVARRRHVRLEFRP